MLTDRKFIRQSSKLLGRIASVIEGFVHGPADVHKLRDVTSAPSKTHISRIRDALVVLW